MTDNSRQEVKLVVSMHDVKTPQEMVKALAERGISHSEIARKTGCSRQLIQFIKTGKRSNIQYLYWLAMYRLYQESINANVA